MLWPCLGSPWECGWHGWLAVRGSNALSLSLKRSQQGTKGPLPLALVAGGDTDVAKEQGEGAAASWNIEREGRRFAGWSLKSIRAKELLLQPCDPQQGQAAHAEQ